MMSHVSAGPSTPADKLVASTKTEPCTKTSSPPPGQCARSHWGWPLGVARWPITKCQPKSFPWHWAILNHSDIGSTTKLHLVGVFLGIIYRIWCWASGATATPSGTMKPKFRWSSHLVTKPKENGGIHIPIIQGLYSLVI